MNLFNIIYLVWILSEIGLNRFRRSNKTDQPSTDKNTSLILWLTLLSSITVGVVSSKTTWFPIVGNDWLGYVGITTIVVGILIRFMAIKQLGKFFTVDVTIRENHQLLQTGFYKNLRHPTYTGSLLSFLGFGLSLNNWVSLLIVFVPTLFAFIHRMNVEEKLLTSQFGKQYVDYMANSKRLIPFIY